MLITLLMMLLAINVLQWFSAFLHSLAGPKATTGRQPAQINLPSPTPRSHSHIQISHDSRLGILSSPSPLRSGQARRGDPARNRGVSLLLLPPLSRKRLEASGGPTAAASWRRQWRRWKPPPTMSLPP
jgi:hypothetical protein